MIDHKKHFLFLHGLSGAGKGELQRVLIAQYESKGYQVIAVSSGDLFREAKNDPEIAAQMQAGKFPVSLALILPGLKQKYREFLSTYQNTDGKSILILDGAIRRSAISDENGFTPSQIEQIATAFHEVEQESGLESASASEIADAIRDSRHIIVDVMPEDAELQMRLRVNKTIKQLGEKLTEHIFPGALAPQIIEFLPDLIKAIAEVTDVEVTNQNYEELKNRFSELRSVLFTLAELTLAPSLIELLQKMDLVAELRDDDILSETRQKRISNLLVKNEGKYEPGLAAVALEEVGIKYDVAGQHFVADRSNCIVIENGQQRGIDFETFKQKCAELAQQLVTSDIEIKRGVEGESGRLEEQEHRRFMP